MSGLDHARVVAAALAKIKADGFRLDDPAMIIKPANKTGQEILIDAIATATVDEINVHWQGGGGGLDLPEGDGYPHRVSTVWTMQDKAFLDRSTADGIYATPASVAIAIATAIVFGGTGVASTIAHSDHNHDSTYAALQHTHTASQIVDATVAGRALLTATDVPAQRTALGLTGWATKAYTNGSTTDVTEGTNLYYTDTRARAAISGTAPISVSAGVITHLGTDGYMHVPATSTTNSGRALVAGSTAGSAAWTQLTTAHISGLTGWATKAYTNGSTTDVAEGTNLYYTDARARAACTPAAIGAAPAVAGGYLPLSAGAGSPLTGVLYGTSASFSAVGGITVASAAKMCAYNTTWAQFGNSAAVGSAYSGYMQQSTGALNMYFPSGTSWVVGCNADNLTILDVNTTRAAFSVNVTGNGSATFGSIIKTGGTSSQFLKADGSVDSGAYALASAIPAASSTIPAALGTAAVGAGTTWARADHVHAMPTAAQVGARAALAPASGTWWQGTPIVGADGGTEIGQYLDFHSSAAGTSDYDVRLNAVGAGLAITATNGATLNGVTLVVSTDSRLSDARTPIGGPYLPLSAGHGYALTGQLYGASASLSGTLSVNGSAMPAWGTGFSPIMLGGEAFLYSYRTAAGTQPSFGSNFYHDGSNLRCIATYSDTNYPRLLLMDTAGTLKYLVSHASPTAGAAITDLNSKFSIDRYGNGYFAGNLQASAVTADGLVANASLRSPNLVWIQHTASTSYAGAYGSAVAPSNNNYALSIAGDGSNTGISGTAQSYLAVNGAVAVLADATQVQLSVGGVPRFRVAPGYTQLMTALITDYEVITGSSASAGILHTIVTVFNSLVSIGNGTYPSQMKFVTNKTGSPQNVGSVTIPNGATRLFHWSGTAWL